MATLLNLYTLASRELVTLDPATTIAAAQALTTPIYAAVVYNLTPISLDVTRILLYETGLTPSMTLANYLTTAVTDLFVSIYTTDAIPQKDFTGRYPNRIATYDPIARPGFTVDVGTMFANAADPQRRYQYNDLIITGPETWNFANSFASVNGVLHASAANANVMYVKDGYKNMRTCGASKIMIGDTTKLGGHTVIPLNQSMIVPDGNNPWLGITLKLSTTDLSQNTLLLVIDGYLHILDDTYKMLGTGRVRLNVPRLNLIQNFIHDPNTSFEPPPLVAPAIPPAPVGLTTDAIMQYFQTYFPAINSTVGPPLGTTLAITDISSIEQYVQSLEGLSGLSMTNAQNVSFLYDRLFGTRSFVIVIPNTTVYLKRYPFTSTKTGHQFEWIGMDTPRGMLQYEGRHILPYTLLSADDGQHLVHLDHPDTTTDLVLTAINPVMWPAPQFDYQDALRARSVELIELYSV